MCLSPHRLGLGLCQLHPHMLLHGFQSHLLLARAYISFQMNSKLPYNSGLASICHLVRRELRWFGPCRSKSLDTLGHHCVTFRCGGDVTTRHNNALRNVLLLPFIILVCLLTLNRVAVGIMISQGYILLTYWWLTGIEVCQQCLMSQ